MTEQEPRRQPSVAEIIGGILDINLRNQVDALSYFNVLLTSSDSISPYLTSPQEKDYRPQPHTPVTQIDSIYNNVIYRRGKELGEVLAELQIQKKTLETDREGDSDMTDSMSEVKALLSLKNLNITVTDEDMARLALKLHEEGKPRLAKTILFGYCNRHAEEYAKTEDDEVRSRKLAEEKKSHVYSLFAILTGEDPE